MDNKNNNPEKQPIRIDLSGLPKDKVGTYMNREFKDFVEVFSGALKGENNARAFYVYMDDDEIVHSQSTGSPLEVLALLGMSMDIQISNITDNKDLKVDMVDTIIDLFEELKERILNDEEDCDYTFCESDI